MKSAEGVKGSPLKFLVDFVPENIFAALSDGTLMLQVIFFAIFFGIVLTQIPKESAEPVIILITGLDFIFWIVNILFMIDTYNIVKKPLQ